QQDAPNEPTNTSHDASTSPPGRSYKGIANCTLDSLRFAISTYSGLISMPTASRPRRSATSKVVPLPAKGSRTMHLPEPSLPEQEQVGRQPTACLRTMFLRVDPCSP